MTQVNKINGNVTGLSIAEEASLGVLSSPVWVPLEPNGYSDFGGELTLLSRNPINPSRQRKKGVITDLDASAGWGTDLTQENMQDLLQGFMFASSRFKDLLDVTSVDTGDTTDDFEPASGGDSYVANDLLFAKGFTVDAVNGLHLVTGVPAAATIPVTSSLPALAGEAGTVKRVGFQFATGDAVIDVSGTYPALTTTTKDLTDLGLVIGEFVFIGADATANQFALATSNGFCRVRSISANSIEFDKTQSTMVADAGVGKDIRLFFGTHLRNELSTLIVRRSYNIERTLGAPDDASPAQIQSEYIVGAVPNELSLNVPTADKIVADLTFVGIDHETRTGVEGVKSGTRPALVESDAFNTSDNIPLIKMAKVVSGDASPDPLFAFVQELTLTVNNNVSPNKAIGQLGAFDVSAGTFEVGGEITAYFSNVDAVAAVRNNDDITLESHSVKGNQGISIDIPLMSLGGGRVAISQDEPITIPLTNEAASGAKISADLDYTLSFTFWDYLPTLAG